MLYALGTEPRSSAVAASEPSKLIHKPFLQPAIFNKDFFLLILFCVYRFASCVYVYYVCTSLRRPEKDIRFSGTGVTGCCESP